MRDDMPQPRPHYTHPQPYTDEPYREHTTLKDRLIVLVGCAASCLVTGTGIVWFTSQFVCK